MSKLREAAQQALEALEYDNPAGRTATIATLRAALAEPVQEPVAWYLPSPDGYDSIFRDHRTVMACTGNKWEGFQPLYTAPPQRKPLTLTDLQEALVYVDLIDPDAIDDPENYDAGFTVAQIDELHRRLTA